MTSYSSTTLFLISCFLLISFPGCVLTAVVTLKSIEIYNTHEVFNTKPSVYFQCKGDQNKTELPDVKDVNVAYSFKGEESWQPLTELSSKKCKRCGLYEKDLVSDDTFEEWEFCPSDFKESDGLYTRFTENEFDATFSCPDCVSLTVDPKSLTDSHKKGKGMHVAVVILLSTVVSVVVVGGLVVGFKYWQKKKREQDQARFLKLFEEGDDLEDELGLDTII